MKKITKREERPERTDPAVVEAVAAALDDEAEADLDPVELADAEAEKEEEEQDSEEAEMLKDGVCSGGVLDEVCAREGS
jgi:hypothetical protein